MLADLDELVLTCADPRSRTYIKEAVLCYKAGAYRSSVVACWIAVAFDLVDKIRELAATGDSQAQAELGRFETIQRTNDLPGALKFEKGLPDIARDKFEFISHLQHKDLVRLMEDRNRCAHPSMVSDAEVFEASAELARLHIANAVHSVLSQPVAQGKAAFERVMRDIDSSYFPTRQKDVIAFLSAGPMGKPKRALFRSVVSVLVRTLFSAEDKGSRVIRSRIALLGLKDMHPNMWTEDFPAPLSKLIKNTTDDEGLVIISSSIVMHHGLNTWEYLDEVDRLKISRFVEAFPSEHLTDIDYILDTRGSSQHELYPFAAKRMEQASYKEIVTTEWSLFVPHEAMSALVVHYSHSSNFANANEIGKSIRSLISSVDSFASHMREIIRYAAQNSQIIGSVEFPKIVRHYISMWPGDKENIVTLLADNQIVIQGISPE